MPVNCFWDRNFSQLKTVADVKVKEPLSSNSAGLTVIICVGNVFLRDRLRKLAENAGYRVLPDDDHLFIFRQALDCPIICPPVSGLAQLDHLERLEGAFNYAIDSQYAYYDHERYWRERIRLAENLIFCMKSISKEGAVFLVTIY